MKLSVSYEYLKLRRIWHLDSEHFVYFTFHISYVYFVFVFIYFGLRRGICMRFEP